jgi:hypothetical protein
MRDGKKEVKIFYPIYKCRKCGTDVLINKPYPSRGNKNPAASPEFNVQENVVIREGGKYSELHWCMSKEEMDNLHEQIPDGKIELCFELIGFIQSNKKIPDINEDKEVNESEE